MRCEEFLSDVGMDIENTPEEFLRARSLPYACQKSMQLIHLLVYALGVFALGVEDDLLFEVVPVDEDVLSRVCLPIKNGHSVFQGELRPQTAA